MLEQSKAAEKASKFKARDLFQSQDLKGKSDSADTVLKTTHQNQIPGIQIQEGDKSSAQVVSTVASDGLLVSWNLGNLESLMNGLTL